MEWCEGLGGGGQSKNTDLSKAKESVANIAS
jgi:hypothetical protein